MNEVLHYAMYKDALRAASKEEETDEPLDFSRWECAQEGWARVYVNHCFTDRTHVNSEIVSGLNKLESERPTTWDLSHNHCGRHGLAPIVAILSIYPELHTLRLQGSGLSSAGLTPLISHLKQNTNITSLDLSWNKCLFDSAGRLLCNLLTTNTTIKSLDLSHTGIPPVFLNRIAAKLKRRNSESIVDTEKQCSTPPSPPPPRTPPPYDALLGKLAYLLEDDGWNAEEIKIAVPGVFTGQIDTELQHFENIEQKKQLSDAPEERKMELYGHLRRCLADTLQEPQFMPSVERTIRDRGVTLLLQKVKYHLIEQGKSGNLELTSWLTTKPVQEFFSDHVHLSLDVAVEDSEHPVTSTRSDIFKEIRAVIPNVLLLYTLHTSLLPFLTPFHRFLRSAEPLESLEEPLSVLDLPPNVPKTDFLVVLYDMLAPPHSEAEKLQGLRRWAATELQLRGNEAFPRLS